MVYNKFLSLDDFDVLLKSFLGKVKNPVSFTKNDPLVSGAFSLSVGEVSSPIQTKNGSFSLIRVEKFLEEIPFELGRVYKQIERKLKKEQQDSIKTNLLSSLKIKYNLPEIQFP